MHNAVPTQRTALVVAGRPLARDGVNMPPAIWIALTINTLGYSAQRGAKMALALLASALGTAVWEASLLVMLTALVPMLLASMAGRFSDRIALSRLIGCGSAIIAVALLLPWQFPTIATLFLSATLLGAGFILFQVAIQNVIGLASVDSHRTKNYAALSLTVSLSAVVGPAVTGLVIDNFGHTQTFACLGLLATAATVLTILGKQCMPVSKKAREAPVILNQPSLLTIPPLRKVILASAPVVGAYDLFAFYLPLHAHAHGLTASEIGFVLGAFGIATILVRIALPALSRHLGQQNLLGVCVLLAACGYGALPLVDGMPAITAVAIFIGLTLGCGPSLLVGMTYARAPQGRTGEALGFRLTAANAANMSLPVMFGGLAATFGLATIFFAHTALLGMTTIYLSKK